MSCLFLWNKSQVFTPFEAANHETILALGGMPIFETILCDSKISLLGESVDKSKNDLQEKNSDFFPTHILLSSSILESGAFSTSDNKLMNIHFSIIEVSPKGQILYSAL